MGVVAALRANPADAASERREALLEEIRSLRARRIELERELTAIDDKVSALRDRADAVLDGPQLTPEEEDRQLRLALRSAVGVDAEVIAERWRRASGELTGRAQQLARASGVDLDEAESLESADLAGQSPAIAAAIRERKATVQRRLKPYLADAEAESTALTDDLYEIAVLAAIEPYEGPPSALALVLPVRATVFSEWTSHADDLEARLAWRVLGALSVALRDAGAADAPVRYDRFEGCLSIQVWLGDSDVSSSLRDALSRGFDRLHAEARDLSRARLDLFLAWVDAEMLSGGAA